MNYKLNQTGKIVAGDDVGIYVKIEDDSKNTGGYLIFTCWDPTFETDDVWDDWVETISSLESYLQLRNWSIDWEA